MTHNLTFIVNVVPFANHSCLDSRAPAVVPFLFPGYTIVHLKSIIRSIFFVVFCCSVQNAVQLDFPLFFSSLLLKKKKIYIFSIQHFRIMDKKTGKAIYIYSFFFFVFYSIGSCVWKALKTLLRAKKRHSVFSHKYLQGKPKPVTVKCVKSLNTRNRCR